MQRTATPFGFFLCEEPENGKIYYVVYFTEDDYAHFYRALESVLITVPRANLDMPNTIHTQYKKH